MSFLYPLFLLAGLSLAIPILIHLFNLRKYKTVLFPHTRFLRDIQLSSRKQSQVRYKWLLAARLLFLACLVLAFAQPFFDQATDKTAANKLKIIYLDNSNSMSVKKGARTVLEVARDAVRKQVQRSAPGSKFVLLTNDKPNGYHAQTADKILDELNGIGLSPASKTLPQVLATGQAIMDNESIRNADLYYYSDFQENAVTATPEASLLKGITFYGVPVQANEVANIYIDTAWITSPVLQTGKSNYIVVRSRLEGKSPKENPVLNLTVNGQVKSAASLNFGEQQERVDTLNFQVNDNNWQKIALTVSDASMHFDDTFRIAARSATALSILVINEGQMNPYIQASFRAYNGFRLNQVDLATAPKTWNEYNLVILNGITHIDAGMGAALADALQRGQSVCIFPGRTANTDALNEGLKQVGDIRFTLVDTAQQTASTLQQGSGLVRDMFERIPENVQLPVANWHYVISAGLSANQQSVLAFRNGDPFLARYTPSRGQLYLCATSADLQSGNFPGSYFFTPFLYQMAMQSGSGTIFSITKGSPQPVYLPLTNVSERNTVHAYGAGVDVIPPQRPSGAGLDLYVDQALTTPGFYALAAQDAADSTQVALNPAKGESVLKYKDPSAMKSEWKGANIKWMDIGDSGTLAASKSATDLPLWKICGILAVLMLLLETVLLTRQRVAAAA